MIQDKPEVIKPQLEELQKTFLSQKTKDLKFRKNQLQQLLKGVDDLSEEFHMALKQDLGVSKFQSSMVSTMASASEISHTLQHFEQWSKIQKLDTPVLIGPGSSFIKPEPLGVALVISAWNYPLFTSLPCVAQAIAAGNCVILKPSELAPNSSNVLAKLFENYLDKDCFRVIEGGPKVAKQITSEKFDLIIFTGSPEKGKLVAKAAAENLIPCILELGGKSPTIIDSDANLDNAALRVTQGRFLNAGQTCIACDYVMCHESIKDAFISKLKETIVEFYGKDAYDSEAFARIVNQQNTERLKAMLDEDHQGKIEIGGKVRVEAKYIEPTVIYNPKLDSKLMTEEIFGPLLPIITFNKIEETVSFINNRPKPLALYYFGSKNKDLLLNSTSSGSFVQNDAVFQAANAYMPFGGVQNSGQGACHGIYGFNQCSHLKPIFQKTTINFFPYNARYPPYTEFRKKLFTVLYNTLNISQNKTYRNVGLLASAGVSYALYSNGCLNPLIQASKPLINSALSKLSKL